MSMPKIAVIISSTLVSFLDYGLGFFDHETGRLGSAETGFVAKVLPMSPV